jgi:hypothetical protein
MRLPETIQRFPNQPRILKVHLGIPVRIVPYTNHLICQHDLECMACAECDRLNAELDRRQQNHTSALTFFISVANDEAEKHQKVTSAMDDALIDRQLARLELERHQRVAGDGLNALP